MTDEGQGAGGVPANSTCSELGRGASRHGREDAKIESFEQLPAAVGVTGTGLREVDVRVDEAGWQEAWPMSSHHGGPEPFADIGPVAAEHVPTGMRR
jgi:hypothetical protein